MGKKYTTQEWILKAQLIHGNLYDYSKVVYTGSKYLVTVICTKCNDEFNTRPSKHSNPSHTNSSGCPKCNVTPGGFGVLSKSVLLNKPALANRKANFYIMEISNGLESFYKCGVTTNLAKRANNIRIHYDTIKVIWSVEGTLIDCYDMEQAHLKVVGGSYKPKIRFDGCSECYK